MLLAHGLVEGDVVALTGRNDPQCVAVILAALALDLRVYPWPPRALPTRRELRAAGVRAAVYVGVSPLRPHCEGVRSETAVAVWSRSPAAEISYPLRERLIERGSWPIAPQRVRVPGSHHVRRNILAPGSFAREVTLPLRAGLYLDFGSAHDPRTPGGTTSFAGRKRDSSPRRGEERHRRESRHDERDLDEPVGAVRERAPREG